MPGPLRSSVPFNQLGMVPIPRSNRKNTSAIALWPTCGHSEPEGSADSTYLWLQPSAAPAPPPRSSGTLWTCFSGGAVIAEVSDQHWDATTEQTTPFKAAAFPSEWGRVCSLIYKSQDNIRYIRRNPPLHWLYNIFRNQRFSFFTNVSLHKVFCDLNCIIWIKVPHFLEH